MSGFGNFGDDADVETGYTSLNQMDRCTRREPAEQRLPIQRPQSSPLDPANLPSLPMASTPANKYHSELPHILADGGGAGEAEESMMWYALGYEKTDVSADHSEHLNREDTVLLEDKWRSGWLKHMEQRDGPSTPLPPVEVLPADNILPVIPSRSRQRKKETPNLITPSSAECLESFMDKLSMWQLVSLMDTSRTHGNRYKNERDWMQTFTPKLPEQCTLLRSKLFPFSPFSDGPPSPGPSTDNPPPPPPPGSRPHHSSSATAAAMTNAPARNRSLSTSLAQEKEKERAASVGATQDKALQRALTRQISMSRAWKGKDCSVTAASQTDIKAPAATTKRAEDLSCRCQPHDEAVDGNRSSSPIPASSKMLKMRGSGDSPAIFKLWSITTSIWESTKPSVPGDHCGGRSS
ncbi:hypothetical protein DFH29DRAFT_1001767 [Suillus ampliporus]|nr:hypothetical protein DFH29DRAFT_1001767 [Suillus ampliporus]